MTALQIFDLGVPGAERDFPNLIQFLAALGLRWCFVGDVAVNAYCEPVYTQDVEIVIQDLQAGMTFPNSVLRIQLVTDPRCYDFPASAVRLDVYGIPCLVAALPALFQSLLWTVNDPTGRASTRLKGEMNLLRIVDRFPAYSELLPPALRARL